MDRSRLADERRGDEDGAIIRGRDDPEEPAGSRSPSDDVHQQVLAAPALLTALIEADDVHLGLLPLAEPQRGALRR